MNPIYQLDAWILARHQDLIDWTQRKALWWMQESVVVFLTLWAITMGLRERAVTGWDFAVFALTAGMWFVAFLILKRMPEGAVQMYFPRVLRLVVGLLALLADAIDLLGGMHEPLSGYFADVAVMAIYYFAACDAPKPRERSEPRAIPEAA